MPTSTERRADAAVTVLAPPALRILEAAAVASDPLTRDQAARSNGSRVTTADDYLRALARLGFLQKHELGRQITYSLTGAGRAIVERRAPTPTDITETGEESA
jgi:hypothetical protein